MTAAITRRKVRVTGTVQGVFFRDSCREQAETAEVSGWVTNRDDGCVEAVFEGPAERVEQMVSWCRRGPSQASVDGVEVTEQEPAGDQGFVVR